MRQARSLLLMIALAACAWLVAGRSSGASAATPTPTSGFIILQPTPTKGILILRPSRTPTSPSSSVRGSSSTCPLWTRTKTGGFSCRSRRASSWGDTLGAVTDTSRVGSSCVGNEPLPICEQPSTTLTGSPGTHVHLARKYNGEWLGADGPVPFVLDGWVSSGAGIEYDGYLTRGSQSVEAFDGDSEINQVSR